jgi:hypothetical protein
LRAVSSVVSKVATMAEKMVAWKAASWAAWKGVLSVANSVGSKAAHWAEYWGGWKAVLRAVY